MLKLKLIIGDLGDLKKMELTWGMAERKFQGEK